MKETLATLALLAGIFAALIIEQFIPPIGAADGARVFLVPVLFCYGACVLPFPCMLVLAAFSGFLYDFSNLQISGGSVEIQAGWSILLFVAFGAICQGVRPLVLRGQWWYPPILSAVTTIALLAFQFLMISMRRFDSGGLFWNETVAWRILAPGALASMFSLLLFLAVTLVTGFRDGHRSLRDFQR